MTYHNRNRQYMMDEASYHLEMQLLQWVKNNGHLYDAEALMCLTKSYYNVCSRILNITINHEGEDHGRSVVPKEGESQEY